MMSILTLLAPIILKGVDLWLDKVKANKEARRRFLELIDELSKQGLASVNLRRSYAEQIAALKGTPDEPKADSDK